MPCIEKYYSKSHFFAIWLCNLHSCNMNHYFLTWPCSPLICSKNRFCARLPCSHPYHSIRLVAREALWKHGVIPNNQADTERSSLIQQQTVPRGRPQALVFIKGDHDPGNAYQIPRTYQAYTTTDSGPCSGRALFSFSQPTQPAMLNTTLNTTRAEAIRLKPGFSGGFWDLSILISPRVAPDADT